MKIKVWKKIGILFISSTLLFSTVIVTGETLIEKMNPESLIIKSSFISNEQNQATTNRIKLDQRPFEPNESWIFRASASNSGYRVWENYWDLNNLICYVHWWGLSLKYPWTPCDPEEMTFEIIFWDTLFGNPIYIYQVTRPAIATGKYYNGTEMFYWETELDPCCELIPNGWVSIQSIESQNNCWFLGRI
jgi:hypothetical protein